MKTYLPKKTNDHSVPKDVLFDGVKNGQCNDNAEFEKRKAIILHNNHEYTKQKYEKMGIRVLEENNDLFYAVDLPDGWKVKSEDHYWTDVFDNKGRKRISYFSKLSSYDRDAFSNFCIRYFYSVAPFDDYKTSSTYEERKFKPWTLYITDGCDRIKKLNEITPSSNKEFYNIDDLFNEEAKAYLNQNYPGWEDPDNYWD